MNRIYTTIIICLISSIGYSQSSDLGNWLIYFGNKQIDSNGIGITKFNTGTIMLLEI